jgi:hypothetical protein
VAILLDNAVPPEAEAYQSIVEPDAAVADIGTVPIPHLEPVTGDEGAEGRGLTVTFNVNETVTQAPNTGVTV